MYTATLHNATITAERPCMRVRRPRCTALAPRLASVALLALGLLMVALGLLTPLGAQAQDTADAAAPTTTPIAPITSAPVPLPDAPYRRADGTAASLREHQGFPVVAHVWATWCVPCIAELPELLEVLRVWEPRGVRFVVIAMDAPDTVHAFLKQHPALRGLPVVTDETGRFLHALRAEGVPYTVLYAANGTEITRYRGAAPWVSAGLQEQLARALASGVGGQ